MRRRMLLALPPALALAACTPPSRGGPGPILVDTSRHTVNGINVAPQVAWSRLPASVLPWAGGEGEIWTIDGPVLDVLRFHGGVAPGGALGVTTTERPLPRFRAGMTTSEIAELVIDTVAARGNSRVEMLSLAPASFAARDGFQLDYRFLNAEGLELRGRARGAVDGGRLHLIVFEAAADHYFPKHAPIVDRLMDSAQLV